MGDFELPATEGISSKKGKMGVGPSISVNSLPGEEETKIEAKENTKELEKPKYSKEELLRVFDEIIFSGEYSEQYMLRGKVPVVFKTRTAEDINNIQRTIDSAGLNLISSVETLRSIKNLQYSLVSYHNKDFSLLKPEDRVKAIEKLPSPIVGALLDLMIRFDEKVALACKEGEENF